MVFTDRKGDKLLEDTRSFGAPRAAFDSVVGPTKRNYVPCKGADPGPGQYTTTHPYKEIGGAHVNVNRYSMNGGRR